jgi:hypothetical protein
MLPFHQKSANGAISGVPENRECPCSGGFKGMRRLSVYPQILLKRIKEGRSFVSLDKSS